MTGDTGWPLATLLLNTHEFDAWLVQIVHRVLSRVVQDMRFTHNFRLVMLAILTLVLIAEWHDSVIFSGFMMGQISLLSIMIYMRFYVMYAPAHFVDFCSDPNKAFVVALSVFFCPAAPTVAEVYGLWLRVQNQDRRLAVYEHRWARTEDKVAATSILNEQRVNLVCERWARRVLNVPRPRASDAVPHRLRPIPV
jgi:hypothetical protein